MQATEQLKMQMQQLGICVIIPTYNNCRTLESVISGVLEYTSNLIVVDDGSFDETPYIIDKFKNIHHLNNYPNQGKGVALYKGMKYAIDKGFQYAITIDSDGQHNPGDIPQFVNKLNEIGEALIIGKRFMEKSKVPGKSYFGRDFSNFWFSIETGIKHPDTQSGFRLYPLMPIKKMKLLTKKFEFEIEIIVRLAWNGINVESVPVSVVYFPENERVSHFRPGKDFTRISILNTVLVTLAICYYRPMLFFKNKNLTELLFATHQSRSLKSMSIAFGVFMGIIPIWGFQLIIAIALAFLFRLNKALVIIFANISIPPMIPLILYLSMLCGKMWVLKPVSTILWPISLDSFRPYLTQYIFGSITLAIVSAAAAWLISYTILFFTRHTDPNL